MAVNHDSPDQRDLEKCLNRINGLIGAVKARTALPGEHLDIVPDQVLSELEAVGAELSTLQVRGEEYLSQYRSLFDASSDAIFLTSPDGEVAAANPAARAMFGYSEEELRALGRAGILDESDPRLSAAIEEWKKTGRIEAQELTAIRRGGVRFPVEVDSVVLPATPLRSFVILHDISFRKQAEEALRESEERLRTLADSMPQLVWITREDGEAEYFNSKSSLYYGVIRSTDGSWRWKHIIHPDDRETTDAAFSRAIETRSMYQTEHRMLMADASYRWHLSRGIPVLNGEGSIIRWYGTCTDIQEQKHIEENLRFNERWFLTAAQLSKITISQVGTDHRYQWLFNPPPGFSAETVLGRTEEDIFPREVALLLQTVREKAIRTGTVTRTEIPIPLQDGVHYFDLTIEPQKDSQGEVTSTISSSIDVTEKKAVEEDLRVAKEEADAANRAKTEFLANMSHEFRTPLGGIIGMADLLLTRHTAPDQVQYISLIRDSAQSLLSIIGDVLDISRIESGKIEITEHEFSLRTLIGACVDQFLLFAERKGLSLSSSLEEHLHDSYIGDAEKLAQVLRNLVSNAIKYTNEGSVRIHVRGGRKTRGGIELVFTVSDTGNGVPPEKQDYIFGKFTRIIPEQGAKQEGTGLGLAITKQLVKLMGGEICLESEVGIGSTFIFTVALKHFEKPPHPTRGESMGPREQLKSRYKILLAEDTHVNRLFLETILKDVGHSVKSVENGEEAVEAVSREPFDIVLMDIQMPVMDGIDATKRIRALPVEWHRLPIVALTAYAMRGDRERMLEAGMDEYVTKPVDISHLLKVVGRVSQSGEHEDMAP